MLAKPDIKRPAESISPHTPKETFMPEEVAMLIGLVSIAFSIFVFCLMVKHWETLIVVALLAFLFCGCGTSFPPDMYVLPDVPQSELATLRFDTTYFERYVRPLKDMDWIEIRIHGKRALRQQIEADKNNTVPDVRVAPGTQDIFIRTRYHVWGSGRSVVRDLQVTTTFSAELKSGGTYLVQVFRGHHEGHYIELVDKETGEDVARETKTRYGTGRRPEY